MIGAGVDWAALEHAYGPATDVPDVLHALLSEDPDAIGKALSYLDVAVLHQGTLYSSTAPAALSVTSLLGEAPADVREQLLEWLARAAESAADREPDCADAEAVQEFRSLSGELLGGVQPFVADPDRAVRAAARKAATSLIGAPGLGEYRGDVVALLNASRHGRQPDERADIAIAIGVCGRVPWDLLADSHLGVRTCAALAPVLDPDPAALDVLKVALRDPQAVDAWFDDDLPQLARPVRYAIVDALLRRTERFEEIAPLACAVARVASGRSVAHDWGPLLHRAFERRYRPGRTVLTQQQRDFLRVIADNDACWTVHSAIWLERAGLPVSRAALRALT